VGEVPAPEAQVPAPVPTCFRHPGRETYLSCTRCGRPACPDCLRDAPVGQQCVECIREGNQGVRRPSGAFGGRVTASAAVTWAILGLNVLFYLIEVVYPALWTDWAMVGKLGPHIGVADGQYYRLITSAFLPPPGYTGLMDIAFNMWALIIVGPALERTLGHLRFASVYLLSALAGSVFFYYLAPADLPAGGASGAIFGLFGAWFVVSKRLRLDTRAIVFLIVLNLAFSLAFRSTIAWQAHVGGLIAGSLLTAAYAYAPRAQRALVQIGATAVVLAMLVLAVAARDHALASQALG
jgi:membrane associated rhomboid family serine protease